MASQSAFGRRHSGVAKNAQIDIDAADKARVETVHNSAIAALNMRSVKISALGQIGAFVGVLCLFFSAMLHSTVQTDLSGLHGWIYLPDAFAANVTFSDPKLYPDTVTTNLRPIGSRETIVVWLLGAVGLVAIVRRHWVFAGLATAFLLATFAISSQFLQTVPFILFLYALATVLMYAELSRRTIIGIVVAMVLLSPLVFSAVSDLSRSFGPSPAYAKYRMVLLTSLVANAGQEGVGKDERGHPLIRGSTFASVSVDNKDVAAYVLAQEYALRGDVQKAATAVTRLDEGPLFKSNFDQNRLGLIRNFVTLEGGFGEQAQRELQAANSGRTRISLGVALLGILLCLISPLSDRLSARIATRGNRLAATKADIDCLRGQLKETEPNAQRLHFGTGGIRRLVQSKTISDSEAVLDAIEARLRFYLFAGLTLLATSVLTAITAYLLWLPAAESNTAFLQVSLAGDALTLVQRSGASVTSRVPSYSFMLWLMKWVSVALCVAGVVVLMRRSRPMGVAAMIAALGIYVVSMLIPILHSWYEVSPNLLSTTVRRQLIEATKSRVAPSILADTPLRSSAGQEAFHQQTANGGIVLKSPQEMVPVSVDGAVAAYTLAQIAYIEGDAAEASERLSEVQSSRDLVPAAHQQRLALIYDWVASHQLDVSKSDWLSGAVACTHFVRTASRGLLLTSIMGILMAGVAAALFGIASRRKTRIEALARERKFAVLTAAVE
ncbi:hypothetical protein [Rhizobium sp. 57MFTsu3.2]|uniref:hypothetical protein n=1 Tax=Rhizobium sp. 57MFTsu3.2 TaxID=1048681 RepID=UPI00146CB7AA|nr:hypothetical protein [Rhizobium sp. 57MFTsu3.2]NMN73997.1 hypothetical protein [Rhizobium sp. 57MFTsu3.2]